MHRPGVELTISRSQVWRPNHYTTEPPARSVLVVLVVVVMSSRFVWMCRKMSSLFRSGEQQDSHEFLRCILLYVQETTRAINQQRAVHHDIIKSHDLKDGSPSTNEAHSQADVSASLAENSCLPDSMDFNFPLHSAQQNPQPDAIDSLSPPVTTNMTIRVSNVTPMTDCLFTPCPDSGASENTETEDAMPRMTDCSESAAGTGSKDLDTKKLPSAAGKITNYFAAAPPAPKKASDIKATTSKAADFVEVLYEGKSERTTRCLECECRTRCTETFQDVEVVAQKAAVRPKSMSDSDDDDDGGSGKR